MNSTIRIGIIGDYRMDNASHAATNAALQHAAAALGACVRTEWLPTDSLNARVSVLGEFDGLLCAPGSPYSNMDGALAAIRNARENNHVFLGTCGGFQHTVIEFARNVLGIQDAEHEETSPKASNLFINRLSCPLVGITDRIRIKPDTQLGAIFGCEESIEQFWCSFGVNPKFAAKLEAGGLKVSATDGNGNIRAIELPSQRFFAGTLFIPQLSSTEAKPHPVMTAFVNAASWNGRPKNET